MFMYCHNTNIGFAIKCEVQGTIRLKVCLGLKHTLTNGGTVEGMKPNDSQLHYHFGSCTRAGVVNVQSLVGKVKNHQIGPVGHHWKDLEMMMFKEPSHCSFGLELHKL